MRNPIISVSKDLVVVLDPNGNPQRVLIDLTPSKRMLTTRTVRSLLATGFLFHYDTNWVVDHDLIVGALLSVRRRILAIIDGVAA